MKRSASSELNSKDRAKSQRSSTEVIKGPWSQAEDQLMKKAVAKYGTDWKSVATMVPGRTSKQCRDRYKLKLDPSINHGPWTPEEDQKLLELQEQEEFRRQWTKIAKLMPGRTENSVKSRAASLERLKNREWTQEEDEILRQCHEKQLTIQQIKDTYLPKRTESAIQRRWEKLAMKELADELKRKIYQGNRTEATALPSSSPANHPPVSVGPSVHLKEEELPFHPPTNGFDPSHYPSSSTAGPLIDLPGSPPELNTSQSLEAARESILTRSRLSEPFEPMATPPIKSEHPYGFFSTVDQQPEGVKASNRVGNLKKQTTSVAILQQIIGEPLKNI